MSDIELKPCPFCGSKVMITASIKKGYAKSVICFGCFSEHEFQFPYRKFRTNKDLHEAIAEKWNRRQAMIENIYAHKGEDHAIRQFALGLERFIAPFAAKNDLPYATAICRLISDAPSTFRECGYSFDYIQFRNQKRKGKKLVSCEAFFNIPEERSE